MVVLEMIKFEHTIFALPFAYLGAFLAARGLPEWSILGWVLLAMVGARSAAMAFNRLVDREYDARNPRTWSRALPRGKVSVLFVLAFTLVSCALFVVAAWRLNPLALYLSPLALFVVLGYSYTKRFTSLSHLFLGLALGIAPIGGWIAVRGSIEAEPLVLALGVLLWVGGFDIIYACQDVDFDKSAKLFSLPGSLGIRRALTVSSLLHVGMVLTLVWLFYEFQLSFLSWLGLLLVAGTLVYEHRLVKPNDLSRVDAAFFTMNGIVSIVLFLFVGIDLCLVA